MPCCWCSWPRVAAAFLQMLEALTKASHAATHCACPATPTSALPPLFSARTADYQEQNYFNAFYRSAEYFSRSVYLQLPHGSSCKCSACSTKQRCQHLVTAPASGLWEAAKREWNIATSPLPPSVTAGWQCRAVGGGVQSCSSSALHIYTSQHSLVNSIT